MFNMFALYTTKDHKTLHYSCDTNDEYTSWAALVTSKGELCCKADIDDKHNAILTNFNREATHEEIESFRIYAMTDLGATVVTMPDIKVANEEAEPEPEPVLHINALTSYSFKFIFNGKTEIRNNLEYDKVMKFFDHSVEKNIPCCVIDGDRVLKSFEGIKAVSEHSPVAKAAPINVCYKRANRRTWHTEQYTDRSMAEQAMAKYVKSGFVCRIG